MTRADPIWAAVDRWLDGADPTTARRHRVGTLAVRRLRETGRPVPEELAREERDAAVMAMLAPEALRRVREAVEGPVIILKGPEVAQRYPDPAARSLFHDVDLLVPDAPAVQEALIRAGFTPLGNPRDYALLHHLQPLQAPGLPLLVEVHRRPKWLRWQPPIDPAPLFAAARPSATGVEGLSALDPVHHALVVALHSWSDAPLARLRDLIDLHLLAAEAARADIDRTARAWGLERVWRSMGAVTDWLAGEGEAPLSVRTWARSLVHPGPQRWPERALRPALSPFWAMEARRVPRAVASVAARDLVKRVRRGRIRR